MKAKVSAYPAVRTNAAAHSLLGGGSAALGPVNLGSARYPETLSCYLQHRHKNRNKNVRGQKNAAEIKWWTQIRSYMRHRDGAFLIKQKEI